MLHPARERVINKNLYHYIENLNNFVSVVVHEQQAILMNDVSLWSSIVLSR